MGKSRRVRLRDTRDIYLLLGECCEVGGDLDAWRLRMCDGLGRLLRGLSVNGALVTPDVLQAGKLPLPGEEAAFDWGWQSDEQRRVFADYWQRDMGWTDPTFLAMIRLPRPVATRRRCELVDDRTWYGGAHFNDFYRRADVDDCMISRTVPPPDSGLAMFYVRLTRAMGDAAYTVREQRILRLFVAGLAPLIGAKLATLPRDGAGLSPRMRQVLALLLRGLSEKQVAGRLGISRHTVHDYVKALHKHFGVSSRGELLAACLTPGGARRPPRWASSRGRPRRRQAGSDLDG